MEQLYTACARLAIRFFVVALQLKKGWSFCGSIFLG